MIYFLLKKYLQMAMRLYMPHKLVHQRAFTKTKGPILFAANHPSSFLDAVVIGILFNHPVWFLARGDVFKYKWAQVILHQLKLIPIYRISEGKENLHKNEDTFEKCREIFACGESVVIFSEGHCENKWELRPIKKGTARLAHLSWHDESIGHQLKVIPVALNYDSFNLLRKSATVQFGKELSAKTLDQSQCNGDFINEFNSALYNELDARIIYADTNNADQRNMLAAVINNVNTFSDEKKLDRIIDKLKPEIKSVKSDEAFQHACNKIKNSCIVKNAFQFLTDLIVLAIIAIPAFIGFVIHWPYNFLLKKIFRSIFKNTVYYDSVVVGAVVLAYPLYAALISLIFVLKTHSTACWSLMIILPVTIFAAVMFRENFNALVNYLRLTSSEKKSFKQFFSHT